MLDGAADNSAFPIEEHDCKHTDQRREQHGSRRDCAEQAAAAKFVSMEQEGQGNAYGRGKENRCDGNEQRVR